MFIVIWALTLYKAEPKASKDKTIHIKNSSKKMLYKTDIEQQQAPEQAAATSAAGNVPESQANGAAMQQEGAAPQQEGHAPPGGDEPKPKRVKKGPPVGREIVPGAAFDGECCPVALSLYLKKVMKKTTEPVKLRLLLTGTMRKNSDRYEPEWNKTWPTKESFPAAEGKKYEDYVQALSGPSTWWGYIELPAIAAKFDIPIAIHEGDRQPQVINRSSKYPWCML